MDLYIKDLCECYNELYGAIRKKCCIPDIEVKCNLDSGKISFKAPNEYIETKNHASIAFRSIVTKYTYIALKTLQEHFLKSLINQIENDTVIMKKTIEYANGILVHNNSCYPMNVKTVSDVNIKDFEVTGTFDDVLENGRGFVLYDNEILYMEYVPNEYSLNKAVRYLAEYLDIPYFVVYTHNPEMYLEVGIETDDISYNKNVVNLDSAVDIMNIIIGDVLDEHIGLCPEISKFNVVDNHYTIERDGTIIDIYFDGDEIWYNQRTWK